MPEALVPEALVPEALSLSDPREGFEIHGPANAGPWIRQTAGRMRDGEGGVLGALRRSAEITPDEPSAQTLHRGRIAPAMHRTQRQGPRRSRGPCR